MDTPNATPTPPRPSPRTGDGHDDTIPPRTFLLSNEPIGLGTPWAESPSSYFTRVAARNGLTPLQLIHGTNAAPLTRSFPGLKPLQHSGKGCFHRRAVATSAAGQKFIEALVNLVGRAELRRMHWATSFPDYSLARMARDCDVWCTDCLRTDSVPYGRWLWEIPLVTECSIHRCRLETSCPSCHRTVRWAAGSDVVHCRHCGFDRRDAVSSHEGALIDTSVATQVGEVVARATSDEGDLRCSAPDCVSALREFARRQGHAGLGAEAVFLDVDRVSLWNWQHGEKSPSISRIMESALRLHLPVIDVLRGIVPDSSCPATSSQPRGIAKRWSCVRLTSKRRAELVRRLSQLARAFPSMGPLRAADKLGVEPVTLNQISPALCAAMVASRKRTLARLRKAKFAWFVGRVDRYVSLSTKAGERPSWSGLIRQFRRPGILRDPRYGQYAQDALRKAHELPLTVA